MIKKFWNFLFGERKYYVTHEGETNFKLLNKRFKTIKKFDKLEDLEKYLKK